MGMKTQDSQSIVYFDREGRENLAQVLRVVKRLLRKRQELRAYKLIVFTAIGEGPAIAYNLLQEYDPTIIAVTFPPGFYVVLDGQKKFPQIPEKVLALFQGLNIKVITARLPLDEIENLPAHNEQMRVIKEVLTLVGGGFVQCVQAVLQACDHGLVEIGERVISITGDSAALITASNTKSFLTSTSGLSINEIFCKARNLTIARPGHPKKEKETATLFPAVPPVEKRKELQSNEPKTIEAKKR